ncbi:hypothetical protein Theos_1694 [Thermus oshimai JL-2]|uniref:Uncharacterized protein n=1 Tax=Thermus oshimai JL-2 TaxID=751945 RepID=K7RK03_THEOS|nr:hypothetical protein [Thermus oshimai]AFV76717.1 hypothetical protein Theos_1694 [Thermus oshimai JL-2]
MKGVVKDLTPELRERVMAVIEALFEPGMDPYHRALEDLYAWLHDLVILRERGRVRLLLEEGGEDAGG